MDIKTVIRNEMQRYKENESKLFSVVINNTKEERRYNDILRVNYWISKKTRRTIYKVYMKNGEEFYLDNDTSFNKSYVPMGINCIGEVSHKRYL